jgi:hypothetical protein
MRTVQGRELARATAHMTRWPATRGWLKSCLGLGPVARSSGEAAHMPAQGYAHTVRGHHTRTGAVARSSVAQWWLANAKV